MNVAVIGSRTFDDYILLYETLDKYEIAKIISGGAKGADSLAKKYSISKNIPILELKPNWDLGRHAGLLRNTDIVNAADIVIAFWDGKSNGTRDSINKAKKLNKTVNVIIF